MFGASDCGPLKKEESDRSVGREECDLREVEACCCLGFMADIGSSTLLSNRSIIEGYGAFLVYNMDA
jgi:hypothetical protein